MGLTGALSSAGLGHAPRTQTADVDQEALSVVIRRQEGIECGAVVLRPAHRVVQRRVDHTIRRCGGPGIALGLGEVTEDRMRAPRLDLRGLFRVPHERVDPVPRSHERIEHGRSQIAGSAGQEDPHG